MEGRRLRGRERDRPDGDVVVGAGGRIRTVALDGEVTDAGVVGRSEYSYDAAGNLVEVRGYSAAWERDTVEAQVCQDGRPVRQDRDYEATADEGDGTIASSGS